MRALLVILLPALLLAACGQKGALYLPSQAPTHHHRPGHGGTAATAGSPATAAAPLAGSGPAASTDNPNPPPTGAASSGTP